MGVQYTGGPIEFSISIDSSTSLLFRNGIDEILSPVCISRTPATGGFKYLMQSPDGLQMKIWVQDLGDAGPFFTSAIRITATSADEMRTGPYALLVYANGYTYTAWANKCGFFIAVLGDITTPNNFAAAILSPPAVSSICNAGSSPPDVTELWCSSAGNEGLGQVNFRNSRYASANWALSYGNPMADTLYSGIGSLDMVPFCEANNVDWAYGSPGLIQRYSSGTGLRVDPLISVGAQIYGQLWDAHYYTLPATVDSNVSLMDTDSAGQTIDETWLAWNNTVPSSPTGGAGTVLGTLFLLTGAFTNSVENVAY